jgi:hypothetical protein
MGTFTSLRPQSASKIYEKKNASGKVFCRIDRKTKTGIYTINADSSQHALCEKVVLDGFDSLPAGFYTNDGIGLAGGGVLILREVHAKFRKKVDLTVRKLGDTKLDSRGKHVALAIAIHDLGALNATVRTRKRIYNEDNRSTVRAFLAAHIPRHFEAFKGARSSYAPGALNQILKQPEITQRLNTEDRQALESFIPEYLTSIEGTLRARSKLKVVFDSLDAGKQVFLKKVVKEFKQKLSRQVQNEAIWQEFLRENILLLRNNYGHVIEKESVALKGKFPDFMLIDPYSYLDIYEIKKPSTTLLKLDKSRNNYYWDVEIAKAISQVENYLHQVQRNSDSLITDLRKAKSLEVSIVRPRGYIIAGTRSQLKGAKMVDDFRILSASLKNIDVLLYDDLLQNLEAFVDRLGS